MTDETTVAEAEQLPIPTPENPWRTTKYIAEAVTVREYTVREWCKSGRIKAYKVMGEWRILHSDFVAFCQKEWGTSDG